MPHTPILSSGELAKEVINHLKEMVAIIDIKASELVDLSPSALDYLGKENFEAFRDEHECICEYFEPVRKEGYLNDEHAGSVWIEKILDSEQLYKASILGRIFKVRGYTVNNRYVVATFTDITELEAHQEALFQQKQLLEEYRKIVNSIYIVSRTDLRGRITYANDLFCEISGYRREELLGRPHSLVRHPAMKKEVFAQMWETIADKRQWHGIMHNKKKNGSTYIVDATISPVLNRDGEIAEYIAFRTDITELHQKQLDELSSTVERAVAIHDQELTDAVPMPSAIVDAGSCVMCGNEAFGDLFYGTDIAGMNLEARFIPAEGYVSKDPVFDWKEGGAELCRSGFPRVLIESDGALCECLLSVKPIEPGGRYLVCLTPTQEG